MNTNLKWINIYFGILFLTVILISGCAKSTKKNKEKSIQKAQLEKSIQQEKEDLLAGVSNAVCYSGFRTGQHPDRGEGANNPSKEQVLEDLQIVRNDMGFNLIRLYDSGENSAMVLQLIQEHKLDIRVLLGIWLKAELSAHETCAWLTEPISQEVLDKNKLANLSELKRGISLANKYPNVVAAVNVGNEALVDWNDHKMHVDTVIVEAFDEDWKGNPDNPMGAEKHWGLYNVDRTPKLVTKQ